MQVLRPVHVRIVDRVGELVEIVEHLQPATERRAGRPELGVIEHVLADQGPERCRFGRVVAPTPERVDVAGDVLGDRLPVLRVVQVLDELLDQLIGALTVLGDRLSDPCVVPRVRERTTSDRERGRGLAEQVAGLSHPDSDSVLERVTGRLRAPPHVLEPLPKATAGPVLLRRDRPDDLVLARRLVELAELGLQLVAEQPVLLPPTLGGRVRTSLHRGRLVDGGHDQHVEGGRLGADLINPMLFAERLPEPLLGDLALRRTPLLGGHPTAQHVSEQHGAFLAGRDLFVRQHRQRLAGPTDQLREHRDLEPAGRRILHELGPHPGGHEPGSATDGGVTQHLARVALQGTHTGTDRRTRNGAPHIGTEEEERRTDGVLAAVHERARLEHRVRGEQEFPDRGRHRVQQGLVGRLANTRDVTERHAALVAGEQTVLDLRHEPETHSGLHDTFRADDRIQVPPRRHGVADARRNGTTLAQPVRQHRRLTQPADSLLGSTQLCERREHSGHARDPEQ